MYKCYASNQVLLVRLKPTGTKCAHTQSQAKSFTDHMHINTNSLFSPISAVKQKFASGAKSCYDQPKNGFGTRLD